MTWGYRAEREREEGGREGRRLAIQMGILSRRDLLNLYPPPQDCLSI